MAKAGKARGRAVAMRRPALRRTGPVEDLAVARESSVAVAALRLVVDTVARPAAYSPVFVHGPRGSGREGVAESLVYELRRRGAPFVVFDGGDLKKARSAAALFDLGAEVAEAVRKARVVIVDDFQKLSGAPAGEQVCIALTRAAARGRHVVLISEQPPSMLKGLPRAFMRDPGGLVVAMAAPRSAQERKTEDFVSADDPVVRATAAFYGVPLAAMTGPRRTSEAVRARQVAMFIMYNDERQLSLPAIGRLLGNRDHTTILYGVRKIEASVRKNRKLAMDIDAIRRTVGVKTR